MLGFHLIILILFISATISKPVNPYCAFTCGDKYDTNYLCELLNLNVENKNCEIVPLTDEIREDIIKYFNALRNERALTHDNLSQGSANMNLINYDLELEFLARAQGRFCSNSDKLTPICMRTRNLYVDFIHTALMYSSKDKRFSAENSFTDQIIPTLEHWRRWPYDNGTLSRIYTHKTRDLKVALMYWAQLDYVGCAVFSSRAAQGGLDVSLDTVCMFGGPGGPPRAAAAPVWDEGPPCSACRPPLACVSTDYKGLCGQMDSIKNAYYRWQSAFWKADTKL